MAGSTGYPTRSAAPTPWRAPARRGTDLADTPADRSAHRGSSGHFLPPTNDKHRRVDGRWGLEGPAWQRPSCAQVPIAQPSLGPGAWPDAYLRTTARCSTRSAEISWELGDSSDRSTRLLCR